MDSAELARQVAAAIQRASGGEATGTGVTVVRSMPSRDTDGRCTECGSYFVGRTLILEHPVHGRRSISDRTLHYLEHGLTHHPTGVVLFGEPLIAQVEVVEWMQYLGLNGYAAGEGREDDAARPASSVVPAH